MGNAFNKGEWSEFYAFLKILTDRKIYAANEDLLKIDDIFYPVFRISRKENMADKVYDISTDNAIRIFYKNIEQADEFSVSSDIIKASVKKIFEYIKNTKGSPFKIPDTDTIMKLLKCETVKTDSKNKADIKVIIRDPVTLRENEVGFSIKSYAGGTPTLLNASKATNFIYNINAFEGSMEKVNEIKNLKKRIKAIGENSGKIIFSRIANATFEKNLRKIDSLMPLILSEFLLCFFRGEGKTIAELANKVALSEMMENFNLNFDYEDIKFKIKYLLLNIALGMVPNTNWDGFLRADGGYIVVKENGEIVCYHIHNISQFGEYLFNNTKHDTASTQRHDFGSIYRENGQYKINLNLQIRFT